MGPFCPSSTTTDASEAGIWFDGSGEVYDVDGDFILNLATLYNDSNWQLYDATTGLVNVTDARLASDCAY